MSRSGRCLDDSDRATAASLVLLDADDRHNNDYRDHNHAGYDDANDPADRKTGLVHTV